MTDTQINTIYSTTVVREKERYFFINISLNLIFSTIYLIKIYSGTIKFTYWDTVWFIFPIIIIYTLADKLTYKVVFNVTDKLLTIAKSNLFYKNTKTYNITEIDQIKVEEIRTRAFIPATYDKAVTFFYDEKQIKINLTHFKAHELANAIIAAIV